MHELELAQFIAGQCCKYCLSVILACYGIVTVPVGAWYCRKCESQERAARVVRT